MKTIPLTEEWFVGAVSVERREEGWKPWRIPYTEFDLYPPNGIEGNAEHATGVRLRFRTDATEITLQFVPATATDDIVLDFVLEGALYETLHISAGAGEANWTGLSSANKLVEIWLPQKQGIIVTALQIDDHATAVNDIDSRPKWLTYGSSITQCAASESPSQTWPSIAARQLDFNLLGLGFGGNCHIEPMVARLIRDQEADLISLCLGINVYGRGSLGPRTFKAAIIGLIQIIREKHPNTPIIVISPIFAEERETKMNAVGFTIMAMRDEIADAVSILQKQGDKHLHYRDGLTWFGQEDAHLLSDGLHPNAEGYKLMGERFIDRILQDVAVHEKAGM